MLVEVVRACVRAVLVSRIPYVQIIHLLIIILNYIASFPGFPLLLSRESFARPMETSRDYWRPVETTIDQ